MEKLNLNTVLEGIIIEHKYTFSYDETAKAAKRTHEVTEKFDFSGITLKELLETYALKTVTIKRQGALRSAKSEDEMVAYITKNPNQTIKVGDAGKSPFATGKQTRPMTLPEIIAYIKSLPADQQAEAKKALGL